jgi:hypothetical protein
MSLHNIDTWNNIIYELNGTCDTLEQVLHRNTAEDLTDHMPFLNYLDDHIFCCESCNWWLDISEMANNDNWECRDCSSDEEE